jgi:hypothetical protein
MITVSGVDNAILDDSDIFGYLKIFRQNPMVLT